VRWGVGADGGVGMVSLGECFVGGVNETEVGGGGEGVEAEYGVGVLGVW